MNFPHDFFSHAAYTIRIYTNPTNRLLLLRWWRESEVHCRGKTLFIIIVNLKSLEFCYTVFESSEMSVKWNARIACDCAETRSHGRRRRKQESLSHSNEAINAHCLETFSWTNWIYNYAHNVQSCELHTLAAMQKKPTILPPAHNIFRWIGMREMAGDRSMCCTKFVCFVNWNDCG